jgi:ribonuclease HII
VEISRKAVAWSVGAASVREIERFNIRCASALAMRRAIDRLPVRPDYLLVDGTALPELGAQHEPLVDGDARCHSIAAASVIAKEIRDRLMRMLSVRYPSFGWEENKGYATADHLAALDRLGPTRHHRYGFIPVAQLKLF